MFPVWLKLAWIDVPSFTALMVLALGAGLALTWVAARHADLPPADVLDVALVAVLVGVIGARAGYVTLNWDYYRSHTNEIAQVWQGGLVWHSGLAGGVLGAAIASAWRKLNLRAVLNTLTPGLMAGVALGWIGCYLAGAAYGREVFPSDQWWFLAADLPGMYGLRNPRFATQLLGAAWAAMCFGMSNIECRMSNGRFATSGIRFAATMTLYSAGTFVLGFTRGDAAPMLGAWRLDQVIDAGIVFASVVYILSSIVSWMKVKTHRIHP
jgi:phosphatidylglycerol---prolipoprotein diacylglyceryl transferase